MPQERGTWVDLRRAQARVVHDSVDIEDKQGRERPQVGGESPITQGFVYTLKILSSLRTTLTPLTTLPRDPLQRCHIRKVLRAPSRALVREQVIAPQQRHAQPCQVHFDTARPGLGKRQAGQARQHIDT